MLYPQLEYGSNMPEHICEDCVQDLEVAYRFRMNCESSDTILSSFITVPCSDPSTVEEETGIRSLSGSKTTREIPTIMENSFKNEFVSITEYDRILQSGDDQPDEDVSVDNSESIQGMEDATNESYIMRVSTDDEQSVIKFKQFDDNNEVSVGWTQFA